MVFICIIHSGVLLVLVAAIYSRTCYAASFHTEEKLIGWGGESFKPNDPKSAGIVPNHTKPGWVEAIAWKPRTFIYHNFLSDEECNHLMKLAAPQMKRSTVVGANGSSVEDDYRTSYGTFLRRLQDPVVEAVERRLATWVQIPEVNAEDMQVLRYAKGQYYKVHMDSLQDDEAGLRVATVLLYFSTVEEGGETAFPETSEWADPSLAHRQGKLSDCTNGKVAYRPVKGDALLFFSANPDQTEDAHSMHAGCPVIKGVKWTGTKWFHQRPFRPYTFSRPKPQDLPADPGICEDTDNRCRQWQRAGECASNKLFMMGDHANLGACRKSCGSCEVCRDGDVACYNSNRAAMGYLEWDPAEVDLGAARQAAS